MSQEVLVHEWLASTGGSENVFMALSRAFPDADLLCLWNDNPERLKDRNLKETWLARTPLRRSKVAAIPFLPFVWRHRTPGHYRTVIVSSHLFAHHVSFANAPRDSRKFVYVHTPARYIWTPELDERGASPLARAVSTMLRPLDRRRAQESWAIAANSEFVRERIRSTWRRDATVIYPPVDVELIQSESDWASTLSASERTIFDSLPARFIFGASRFIEYKRLDKVIEIGEHADVPVVLAGSGPLEGELTARATRARVPVTIIPAPSNAMLYALYQKSAVYVFPPVEDFGIMPVEAHAAGCPTLVHDVGGAAESTTDGVTGAVVSMDAPPRQLVAALHRAMSVDRETCRIDARRFSQAAFAASVRDWVDNAPRSANVHRDGDR